MGVKLIGEGGLGDANRLLRDAMRLASTLVKFRVRLAHNLAAQAGPRPDLVDAILAAFRHRAMLIEVCRAASEGAFYAMVGDPAKSVEACESRLETGGSGVLKNLALQHLSLRGPRSM